MADDKIHDITEEQEAAQTPETEAEAPVEEVETVNPLQAELDKAKADLKAAEDKYLRLAAEYDNFRKRTAKEKESIWGDAKSDTVSAFLAVYDNLERAVKQPCTDEAYAKGVEMIMKGFNDVMAKLGVEMIPALGETFDANVHNAVMHVEDENADENTVTEVFQAGFKLNDKVIRFAMVKVAN